MRGHFQYLHGIITGPTRDIVGTSNHGVHELHLDISSLQVSVKVHIKQCLSIHIYLHFGEHRGGQSHSRTPRPCHPNNDRSATPHGQGLATASSGQECPSLTQPHHEVPEITEIRLGQGLRDHLQHCCRLVLSRVAPKFVLTNHKSGRFQSCSVLFHV